MGLLAVLAIQRTPAVLRDASGAAKRMNPYTTDAEITARFSPRDFSPDGNLSKEAWRSAEWFEFDHDMSGQPSYPEARTRVAALWTGKYIYFAFWCKYTALNVYDRSDPARERWELWKRDVVEVFLNPQPERVNHYYEFEVAPDNQWIDLEIDKDSNPFSDASWDSHFAHATHVDAGNRVWTCEMRIPVASMGVQTMGPGSEWRINFYRADGPGDDAHRRLLAWSPIPEGRSFHVPTRFGLLRLLKETL